MWGPGSLSGTLAGGRTRTCKLSFRETEQQSYFSYFSAAAEAGLGFEANSALRFGLGAIIIMLIVSTALSIGHKLYPSIAEFMATNAEGRSLDEMSSLAQYAFEAFEKYQTLNDLTEK